MAASILSIGFIVFVSHLLSLAFRKTNVPDVLILMLIGLLVGPFFGIVQASDFGKVGPIIRDTTYMVVLVSISLCALLVASYPLSPVRRLYAALLGRTG